MNSSMPSSKASRTECALSSRRTLSFATVETAHIQGASSTNLNHDQVYAEDA